MEVPVENIVVDLKRAAGNVHFQAVSADHPQITAQSPDGTDEDVQQVLKQMEMSSPSWIAICGNVEVETTYRLN